MLGASQSCWEGSGWEIDCLGVILVGGSESGFWKFEDFDKGFSLAWSKSMHFEGDSAFLFIFWLILLVSISNIFN